MNKIRFLFVGVIMFGIVTVLLIIDNILFLEHSPVSVEGKVIEVHQQLFSSSPRQSSSIISIPTISFIDTTDKEIIFIAKNVVNISGHYVVGDTVKVLYDIHHPSNARLGSFVDMWGGVFGFGFITVLFLFITIWLLKRQQRKLKYLH